MAKLRVFYDYKNILEDTYRGKLEKKKKETLTIIIGCV